MLYVTGQILETDTQVKRYNFWRNYQPSSRLMKRWLTNLPAEQQKCYAPFVLPYPIDTHELSMLSGYGTVIREQQEKRKEDTDAMSLLACGKRIGEQLISSKKGRQNFLLLLLLPKEKMSKHQQNDSCSNCGIDKPSVVSTWMLSHEELNGSSQTKESLTVTKEMAIF